MSEFDTPEIVAARDANAARESTHLIKTPERERMRARIAGEVYGSGARLRERRAYIVLGPPASGKSKLFAEPLAALHGALLVDADVVKEHLPEFEGGLLASVVHQESSDIADDVLARAARNGENLVLPLVGKNPKRVADIAIALRFVDYSVYVVLNDIPLDVAAERAVKRFQQTGRFVDPEYVYGIGSNPMDTYARLKLEGLVEHYDHYSNDVAQGSPPVLIESGGQTPSR